MARLYVSCVRVWFDGVCAYVTDAAAWEKCAAGGPPQQIEGEATISLMKYVNDTEVHKSTHVEKREPKRETTDGAREQARREKAIAPSGILRLP